MARETRLVTVGDGPLACRVAGAGQPILLVPGHAGTMDLWPAALVDGLARDRQVVLFDHRGFGESPAGPGGPGAPVEAMADDAAGLLEALGIPEADVLGFSMGGLVAQEMALRHPARVRRLVLAATSAGGADALLPDPAVRAALHDDGLRGAARGRAVEDLMFPPGWREAHPAEAARFPVPRHPATAEDARRQYAAVEAWGGSWDRLPALGRRVLVLAGDQDAVTPVGNALRLASRIPGAWLARFPEAGHGLLHQCPSRVLRLVRVFLED